MPMKPMKKQQTRSFPLCSWWRSLSTIKRICAGICLFYLLVAIFGPALAPYPADDFSSPSLLAPSWEHLLGTDEMGHDIFSMLLQGFRLSLTVSIIAGGGSTLLGTLLAFASCYFPRVGGLIRHLANLLLIVPEMVVILFVATFAAPTMTNTVLAIIFFSWPRVFRIAYGKILGCMGKNKVQYTLLMGGNLPDVARKVWRDLYPVFGTLLVLQCNRAVTYETTLSFFGIGDPLLKTWGRLIRSALNYENFFYDNTYLWYLVPAMVCVVGFVVSLSILMFDEDQREDDCT